RALARRASPWAPTQPPRRASPAPWCPAATSPRTCDPRDRGRRAARGSSWDRGARRRATRATSRRASPSGDLLGARAAFVQPARRFARAAQARFHARGRGQESGSRQAPTAREVTMSFFRYRDRLDGPASAGMLGLRLVAGSAFLFHGWGKITNPFAWMPPE